MILNVSRHKGNSALINEQLSIISKNRNYKLNSMFFLIFTFQAQ